MQEFERKHIMTVREISPECMVLLKSDGSFPLNKSEQIALYGSGARKTVKGGTGSGDVNVRHYVTVEEGLENAGFRITTKDWLDGYDEYIEQIRQENIRKAHEKFAANGINALFDNDEKAVIPEYRFALNGSGNVAVYVLARVTGEGEDQQNIEGQFRLTKQETEDILQLADKYEKFLLVLNIGSVIDLSPVLNRVENILLLSQLGTATGDAFADVLLGKSYPSGKLTDTWAKWEDYCHEGDFAEQDDTRYREGIYVGYRYFDTIGKKPCFPFGYGLSYTEFMLGQTKISAEGTLIKVKVPVKNTGDFRGKETVQLYVSVPSGRLDQPYQVLAAFQKTKELTAGEETFIELSFAMEELASFDMSLSAKVLEKGNYILRIGNNSRNTVPSGIVVLKEDVIVEKLSNSGGNPDFVDFRPMCITKDSFIREELPVLELEEGVFVKGTVKQPVIDREALEFAEKMTNEELVYLCIGVFEEEKTRGFIGNSSLSVMGAAGETTGKFAERGIPSMVMADGPAGLRLDRTYGKDEQGVYPTDDVGLEQFYKVLPDFIVEKMKKEREVFKERHGEIHEQYAIAIPIGTALAQSFSPEVCEICGDMIGDEMERFGVQLWLAPALNIHRMPLCGRNFEYYSEDPLISGRMAAGITRGVQKHPGCGVTIKHFVANNQETNRFRSNSIMSQRTLRDIYMRGFEIVIKEAQPYALMTSYNLLNGEHTSQRKDILETVLRQEWGYQGIVMSDWVVTEGFSTEDTKHPWACAEGSISAGNDIMMPGSMTDYKNLINAVDNSDVKYSVSRQDLIKCAARVIMIAWKMRKR